MAKPRAFLRRDLPGHIAGDDITCTARDRVLSMSEFREAIAHFDAMLPTVTNKIGADFLDMVKAGTHTPDTRSASTADMAMTLLLMLARGPVEGENELPSGHVAGSRPMHLAGTNLSGKTLGIVGFDRAGQQMAQRAYHGFGMEILVFHHAPIASALLAQFNARQADTLDALLPQCDFVSLHLHRADVNKHLIDAARLNLMKPAAFLINTAGCDVVNETDLAHALMFETIGGAGLDVFADAPRINPMLAQCENLVLGPRIGNATGAVMDVRMGDNLNDFFNGLAPRNCVA